MAYRQIHTNIWTDEWFLDLEPDEKLLFVYLFSNNTTTLAGIYKISLKVVSFETGLEKYRIEQILEKFSKANKVFYKDGVMWVVNLKRYNAATNSPKVQACIKKELNSIPDCELKIRYLSPDIPYQYPIDTSSLINNNINNNINKRDSEKPSESPKREPTPQELAYYQLQDYFIQFTGLPKPEPKTQRDYKSFNTLWKSPGMSILSWVDGDLNKAQLLVGEAVTRLQKDSLTIANFNSIIKTASDSFSKRNNNNGHHS